MRVLLLLGRCLGWAMLPWSVGWSPGALRPGCSVMWDTSVLFACCGHTAPCAGSQCCTSSWLATPSWPRTGAPLGSLLLGGASAALRPRVSCRRGMSLARVHLRQALLAGAGSAPVLLQHLLRHVRPKPWLAVLDGSAPLPAADWLVSACGAVVWQGLQGRAFRLLTAACVIQLMKGLSCQRPVSGARRACAGALC
jgi:hypothetical protein